ncbi:hypothetical protein AB8Q30_23685, partial [Klebsiella variicola]
LNRLIRCVCGKKIGPDPRNFNQRVSLGRNDLLIRTFPNAGLWNENELSGAEFLENSDRSMIVANLTSVPCRMVFSYVKTSNHPYWMPSQIACEGDEND